MLDVNMVRAFVTGAIVGAVTTVGAIMLFTGKGTVSVKNEDGKLNFEFSNFDFSTD
jgi:hypothetical protein